MNARQLFTRIVSSVAMAATLLISAPISAQETSTWTDTPSFKSGTTATVNPTAPLPEARPPAQLAAMPMAPPAAVTPTPPVEDAADKADKPPAKKALLVVPERCRGAFRQLKNLKYIMQTVQDLEPALQKMEETFRNEPLYYTFKEPDPSLKKTPGKPLTAGQVRARNHYLRMQARAEQEEARAAISRGDRVVPRTMLAISYGDSAIGIRNRTIELVSRLSKFLFAEPECTPFAATSPDAVEAE